MGIKVLIEAAWARGWMPEVYSADASLSGYGIATSCWDGHGVASVGRVHESGRWRLGASCARRHALELAGFVVDEDGDVCRDAFGQPLELDSEMRTIVSSESWQPAADFPEVPAHLLAGGLWKTVAADRWFSGKTSSVWRLAPFARLAAVQRIPPP